MRSKDSSYAHIKGQTIESKIAAKKLRAQQSKQPSLKRYQSLPPKSFMEASKVFEYLIEKTRRIASLNDSQKEMILTDLKYFLAQSLCDLDRKHHTDILTRKWREFEMKVIRTPLLKEPRGFLSVIQEFTGKPPSILEDQKEIAKLDQWNLQEFFEDLLRELENRKVFLDPGQEPIAFCGLKFLLSESKLPAMKLDRNGIVKTWKIVRPLLERSGVFYKYRGAQTLSSKLRLFLTGSL